MTLARGYGYCVKCKASRKIYAGRVETLDLFAVEMGSCSMCEDKIIRVYPSDRYASIPEIDSQDTRKTYSGEQEYSYNRGYYDPENTRAEYKSISVFTLLNDVTDSIDIRKRAGEDGAPWARVIETKAAASHFDAVLSTLIREGFRLPVVMWDQHRSGEWIIGNGHHRITAAILLGIELIPVVVSYGADYMRADDSSDDEDMPIEAAGRTVWQAIRNDLPAQVAKRDPYARTDTGCAYCDGGYGCAPGCCVDHGSQCAAKAAEMPATGTMTREARQGADIRAQAANVAGEAVYNLIRERRKAQREMYAQAAAKREEIERMIEEAARMEQDAIKIDAEVANLWPMYDAACNIAQRN